MISDITEGLIQKTIDEGGKVYAFSGDKKVEIVSGQGDQLKFLANSHPFEIGETIRFLYEPLFKSPYEAMLDTDGDGILDAYDLDADGDGVWDERQPEEPSHLAVEVLYLADAPSLVALDISPTDPDVVRTRLYGVPVIVDRFYPLYLTEEEALEASPLASPSAHSHFLDSREYFMPEGVDQWHGNYHTCLAEAPDLVEVSSIETYDFEFVDRVYGQTGFNSIIPRDYENRLLAIDTDENGSFDGQTNYSLIEVFNSTEDDQYQYRHYKTEPEQSWLYRVTQRRTSESALPNGHSFRLGNYVLDVRVTTKFTFGSDDNEKHTLSILKYFSGLSNGSNATFDSNGGAVLRYVNADDQWVSINILEVHEDGYIVLDEDIFDVNDEFYIHSELPPEAPSNVSLDIAVLGNSVSDVVAIGSYLRQPSVVDANVVNPPTNVSNVVASEVVAPSSAPSLVDVGLLAMDVSNVVAEAEVLDVSNVEALAQVQVSVSDVEAEIIFTPASLSNLLHWYDASDVRSQEE